MNNPESSISILWDAGFGNVWDDKIYFSTIDYGNDYTKYNLSHVPLKYTRYKGMKNALVRLEGLKANTHYYFIIKNTFGLSRRLFFKTAPLSIHSKISFITGGDSRNNRRPRIDANILVGKLRTLFVLFGGDFTDNGRGREWRNWLLDWQLSIAKDGRITPIIVTRGNHEESNLVLTKLFDMPLRGYYSMSFAQKLLRVIVLNSEISISGKQTDWLKEEFIKNKSFYFKTAIYHRPIRPHTWSKKEGDKMYYYWAKLFYSNALDLAVESDSHTVKSTYPIMPSDESKSDEGFIRENSNGTVYVGEGCWGAPLRGSNDSKDWTRSVGSFNQFKLIFLDKEKMQIRTINTRNAIYVAKVKGDDPFEIPSNLEIWNPKEGKVINIPRKLKR